MQTGIASRRDVPSKLCDRFSKISVGRGPLPRILSDSPLTALFLGARRGAQQACLARARVNSAVGPLSPRRVSSVAICAARRRRRPRQLPAKPSFGAPSRTLAHLTPSHLTASRTPRRDQRVARGPWAPVPNAKPRGMAGPPPSRGISRSAAGVGRRARTRPRSSTSAAKGPGPKCQGRCRPWRRPIDTLTPPAAHGAMSRVNRTSRTTMLRQLLRLRRCRCMPR